MTDSTIPEVAVIVPEGKPEEGYPMPPESPEMIQMSVEKLSDKKGAELAMKFMEIGKFEMNKSMAQDMFILTTWLNQVAQRGQ